MTNHKEENNSVEKVVQKFNQAYKMCDVQETTGTNTRETKNIFIEKDNMVDWLRTSLTAIEKEAREAGYEEARNRATRTMRLRKHSNKPMQNKMLDEMIEDLMRNV